MTTPSKPVEETPFLADPSTEMTGAREVSPPPPTPPLPPPVGVDDSQDAEHQQHQKNDVCSYYFFPLYRLINGIKMMLLNVTLEPMLFVKMLAESNLGVVADTLEIDRVCRVNLNFSEDDCQNMDDGNHTDVQGMWCTVLACILGPSLWWLVMVATVLGMFEGAIEPAIRTMLTVVVGENEAGKVLALNGFLEAAWLTVDRVIYTSLYDAFLRVFPQIDLVVQAGVCIVLVFFLLYLRSIFKRQPPPNHTI